MVAAGASYEARAFGVRSGTPLRAAARRCPDAVFLPTDPAAYAAASDRVMATLRRFPVLVEVWGWDEAFIGGDIDDPHALATGMRAAVATETGLSCSIGIGHNKHQAKIAARYAKPGGIFQLTAGNWTELMADQPVGALWGVGPRTGRKLAELGLSTVADLAAADPAALVDRFGERMAAWLPALARGAGDTGIATEPRMARSRSREVTFPEDLSDRTEIAQRLAALARELGRDVVDAGRRVTRVAVKVRYRSFFTQIRIRTIHGGPTTDPAEIERTALTVLAEKFDLDRPVRLLGVRADLALEPCGTGGSDLG
jgi:DNA polymerase-4